MKNYCTIIVAGGRGERMGAPVPKQFMLLKKRPVLFYTIDAFAAAFPGSEIILVLPQDQLKKWKELTKKYNYSVEVKLVAGGNTRFASVKNGLAAVSEDAGVVGIHDGVRPLVSPGLIRKIYKTAAEEDTAIPAVPMKDSIRKIEGAKSFAVDRNQFALIQTPQCFKAEIIKKAYRQEFKNNFTDDASVVEAAGEAVFLTEGEERNIKITTPADLEMAACYLG